MLAFRFKFGGLEVAPVVETIIGRRRRTRRYRTPTPEALRDEYSELIEAAPEQTRKLIGPYLLRGDVITTPSVNLIDWNALARDAETVVKLFDLYLEYVEEEEDLSVILLGEY